MDESFNYVSIKPADNGYIVRVEQEYKEDEDYEGKVLLFLDWEQVVEFVEAKFDLEKEIT